MQNQLWSMIIIDGRKNKVERYDHLESKELYSHVHIQAPKDTIASTPFGWLAIPRGGTNEIFLDRARSLIYLVPRPEATWEDHNRAISIFTQKIAGIIDDLEKQRDEWNDFLNGFDELRFEEPPQAEN